MLLNVQSGDVHKAQLSQVDADFYRKRLSDEIMVRTYFTKIPGHVIGQFIQPPLNSYFKFPKGTFFYQPLEINLFDGLMTR